MFESLLRHSLLAKDKPLPAPLRKHSHCEDLSRILTPCLTDFARGSNCGFSRAQSYKTCHFYLESSALTNNFTMRNIALATLPLLASASALAVGSGSHHHGHFHRRHLEKKDAVDFKTEVVTVCDLNGQILSAEECDAGIAAGRLIWADGELSVAGDDDLDLSVNIAAVSTSAAPTSASSSSVYTPPPTTSSTPTPTPTPSSTSSSAKASATKSSSSSSSFQGSGVDTPFPDDVSCSEFPSDYGAIPIDWMGLGGWIGVQTANIAGASGLDDIMTMLSDMCFGDDCCTEGSYCSYACPAGYQKAQWPTAQGATGQSVGGLLCSDGKLKLTNSNFDTLCIKGTDKVEVQVESELDDVAAVCRTDYPGMF